MNALDRRALPWLSLAASLCFSGCGSSRAAHDAGAAGMGGSSAQCITPPLSLDCQTTFMPTYQAIYDNLFKTTCGASSTGTSCHGPDGGQAGLYLFDHDMAYDYLLGQVDGRARVIPGDPNCSVLAQRLESSDPNFRMPIGSDALPEGTRCAVRKWVAMGAKK